ncbi:GGDEF domain-containing protein [Arthrobacter sp. 2RAF22]|uniref:GGDEF domain-containing protein n=1 Tax=Arthrobacter sp. 2RAF22 TaxID=3232996 RepID=UPI003F925713
MVLDVTTLRVALGVVTLSLLILFCFSFRRTRSPYNGWWCVALLLFLLGNIAFLFKGTEQQIWATPLGNVLSVGGALSMWAAARSLRMLPPPKWQFAAGPAITALASVLDNPASNSWSGGLVYLGLMTGSMALASRDLWLMESASFKTQKSVAWATGLLAAYYFCRWTAFAVQGPDGPVFGLYFGQSMATLVTLVLLLAVSFGMTTLSNDRLISGLSERAARDHLTGLLNRGSFMDLAAEDLRRMHAAHSVTSLILADLDHFKAINDEHGHPAGDASLQAFASACTASVRSTDLLGRYGGEEFIILLPGASRENAETIATEISENLASTGSRQGIPVPTVSYGVTSSSAPAPELTAMIAAADTALYKAKSLGRNRVVSADSRS